MIEAKEADRNLLESSQTFQKLITKDQLSEEQSSTEEWLAYSANSVLFGRCFPAPVETQGLASLRSIEWAGKYPCHSNGICDADTNTTYNLRHSHSHHAP